MLIKTEPVHETELIATIETLHSHDTLPSYILGQGHSLLLRLGHRHYSPDSGTSRGYDSLGHHTLHEVGCNLPVKGLLLGALLSGSALLSSFGVQLG
jgi:hypothetical protein|tara:strand:- start:3665 stop:3955 length:291 start_codon:yes stop_codon:yes gene_type:complete